MTPTAPRISSRQGGAVARARHNRPGDADSRRDLRLAMSVFRSSRGSGAAPPPGGDPRRGGPRVGPRLLDAGAPTGTIAPCLSRRGTPRGADGARGARRSRRVRARARSSTSRRPRIALAPVRASSRTRGARRDRTTLTGVLALELTTLATTDPRRRRLRPWRPSRPAPSPPRLAFQHPPRSPRAPSAPSPRRRPPPRLVRPRPPTPTRFPSRPAPVVLVLARLPLPSVRASPRDPTRRDNETLNPYVLISSPEPLSFERRHTPPRRLRAEMAKYVASSPWTRSWTPPCRRTFAAPA